MYIFVGQLAMMLDFVRLLFLVVSVNGHAFLMEPEYRAYAAGYTTPQGMNCGGIQTQWHTNGGRCGVCGDDFSGTQNNMVGGKFFYGKTTGHYTQGQTIDVRVKITANHLGFFNFSLCVNNDFTKMVTEDCLAKNPLMIIDPDTNERGFKWDLPGHVTDKRLRLELPLDVHCTQCVLRWFWFGGNNWNDGCKGCGLQECFVNCADIDISPKDDYVPAPGPAPGPDVTAKPPITTSSAGDTSCIGDMQVTPDNGKLCTAKDISQHDVIDFCQNMCRKSTFCPKSHCVCYQ